MTSVITSLKEALKRDEGTKGRPYKDSLGYTTIGVGHNLDREPLCEAAIEAQLDFDITTKALPLYERLEWLKSAPVGVQQALLNMAFNLGVPGLLKWPHFLDLIQHGNYLSAREILKGSLYTHQVGKRAARIAELIA